MKRFNRKKLVILMVYVSFFIAKKKKKNETRLIEKKIQTHKTQIKVLETNFSEAYLFSKLNGFKFFFSIQ